MTDAHRVVIGVLVMIGLMVSAVVFWRVASDIVMKGMSPQIRVCGLVILFYLLLGCAFGLIFLSLLIKGDMRNTPTTMPTTSITDDS